MTFRTQAQVNAIGLSPIRVRGKETHRFTYDSIEKLLVADCRTSPSFGGSFLIVNEHEIDVAAVVQLLPAVFTERQENTARRLIGTGMRFAETIADRANRRGQSHF